MYYPVPRRGLAVSRIGHVENVMSGISVTSGKSVTKLSLGVGRLATH